MSPKLAPKSKMWTGGIRMRLQKKIKATTAAEAPAPSSAMKRLLKDGFVKNTLSAPMVQTMAEAAQASGAEGLGAFSQAGSSGWNPKNLARDLYKAIGLDKSPVPFYFFEMDLWDKELGRLQKTSMPVVLPHEVIPWFLSQRPNLDPAARDAAPWWPTFAQHCSAVGIAATETLPVAIWVDSVPYTKRHSMWFMTLTILGVSEPGCLGLVCCMTLPDESTVVRLSEGLRGHP